MRRICSVAVLAVTLGLASLPASPQAPASPSPAASASASPSPAGAYFVVLFRPGPAWDKSRSPADQVHFKDHSQRLFAARESGTLVLGSRYSDTGLMLFRAPARGDVDAWVAADPSVAAGVFTAEVHPWSTVFPGCVERVR